MRIIVSGLYSPRHSSIDRELADMLRYDEGEVVEVLKDKDVLLRRRIASHSISGIHHFRVLVECKQYTPNRWDSFGLLTYKEGMR